MINHKYVLTLAFVATASVLIATILEFGYQAKALEYQSSTSCINGKCHTEVNNSTSSSSSSFQRPSGYSTSCINGKCHTEVYKSNDISIPDHDNYIDNDTD
jgi:hypothetical protein